MSGFAFDANVIIGDITANILSSGNLNANVFEANMLTSGNVVSTNGDTGTINANSIVLNVISGGDTRIDRLIANSVTTGDFYTTSTITAGVIDCAQGKISGNSSSNASLISNVISANTASFVNTSVGYGNLVNAVVIGNIIANVVTSGDANAVFLNSNLTTSGSIFGNISNSASIVAEYSNIRTMNVGNINSTTFNAEYLYVGNITVTGVSNTGYLICRNATFSLNSNIQTLITENVTTSNAGSNIFTNVITTGNAFSQNINTINANVLGITSVFSNVITNISNIRTLILLSNVSLGNLTATSANVTSNVSVGNLIGNIVASNAFFNTATIRNLAIFDVTGNILVAQSNASISNLTTERILLSDANIANLSTSNVSSNIAVVTGTCRIDAINSSNITFTNTATVSAAVVNVLGNLTVSNVINVQNLTANVGNIWQAVSNIQSMTTANIFTNTMTIINSFTYSNISSQRLIATNTLTANGVNLFSNIANLTVSGNANVGRWIAASAPATGALCFSSTESANLTTANLFAGNLNTWRAFVGNVIGNVMTTVAGDFGGIRVSVANIDVSGVANVENFTVNGNLFATNVITRDLSANLINFSGSLSNTSSISISGNSLFTSSANAANVGVSINMITQNLFGNRLSSENIQGNVLQASNIAVSQTVNVVGNISIGNLSVSRELFANSITISSGGTIVGNNTTRMITTPTSNSWSVGSLVGNANVSVQFTANTMVVQNIQPNTLVVNINQSTPTSNSGVRAIYIGYIVPVNFNATSSTTVSFSPALPTNCIYMPQLQYYSGGTVLQNNASFSTQIGLGVETITNTSCTIRMSTLDTLPIPSTSFFGLMVTAVQTV